MQPAYTSGSAINPTLHSELLVKYAQEVAAVQKNLWHIKALKVRYHNSGIVNHALNHHYTNITSAHKLVTETCEKASTAFSFSNLPVLIEHTKLAQRLSLQLHKEAEHFKMMIEKKIPHSKM
jgi:hypothetical protein